MSQNSWNTPAEGQENGARLPDSSSERKHYDGFEGMNYEQRRQPYIPKQSAAKIRESKPGEKNRRRNE